MAIGEKMENTWQSYCEQRFLGYDSETPDARGPPISCWTVPSRKR